MGRSRALDAQEEAWLGLTRRVLVPERPQRVGALAVAGLYPDDGGDAVLEALAARELVPAAWLDDGGERFGASPSREVVLALACDPAGVARAEALALECATRCRPWGARPVTAVRWRLVDDAAKQAPAAGDLPASIEARIAEEVFGHWVEDDKRRIVRSVERAARSVSGRRSDDHSVGSPAVVEGDPPWRARVWDRGAPGDSFLRNLVAQQVWRLFAERKLGVAKTPRGAPEKIKGRPYAEMPSPFEALVELWSTGYYATKLDAAVIELCAPALGRG